MTLQELSQHYKLREQLAKDEEILASLKDAAFPSGHGLDGMPHAPGVSDKVGTLAIEIADMEERIRYLREEISAEETAVNAYIDGIHNDQTRMVFRLRFLHCMTWARVARVVGGGNTENSVKAICYRQLNL